MSKDAEPNVTVQLPASIWEDIKKLGSDWERSGRWVVIYACKEVIENEIIAGEVRKNEHE